MLAHGIAPALPCHETQAAPCPTGPKLCPAPSHAKPSCSCCAGTTQSQEAAAGPEGWCRVPWALRPGPLSERARLSPAENMTSAGASARGETFLSCVDRSRTRRLGLERALGCGREPRVPSALPAEWGDGHWCILTPLQTDGRSLCGGTKQGARPNLTCLALGSLLPSHVL